MIDFKTFSFSGQRVILRLDFNVPLNASYEVTDRTRIKGAVATIKKVLGDGGSVVLMSHLGRPKGGYEEKFSLRHIINVLAEELKVDSILFADDCISPTAFEMSSNLQAGQLLLLENLRFYPEEEKGDIEFAKKLAQHGDLYINDAFGTAHREHASTATIANYFDTHSKGFGYLMAAEIENATKVLHGSIKPSTAIIGGAKVSDKILLLEKLIDSNDNILIGGGMAFTFLKAKGFGIGKSLCELEYLDLANKIIEKAEANKCNIYLPVDVVIADKFAADASAELVDINNIKSEWMGLDIGAKTIETYIDVLNASKTILWNGPMGVFEFDKFSNGTFKIAKAVADATANGAYSLIGGGDSVSAINQSGLQNEVSYISTGGGAMLEFLEGKVLPGIKAIEH